MLRPLLALRGPAALLGHPGPAAVLLAAPARARKSRADPPAKSKAGRVKAPPPVDPAELLVVAERYLRYRRVVRALRWGAARRGCGGSAGAQVAGRSAG